MQLPFVFDFSCPYAYLASTRVEAVAARTGAEIDPQPILLGGVFRAVGTAQNLASTLGEAKARHNLLDMQRWAARFGMTLSMPPRHPVRTVTALRALLASPRPWMPLIHRFFRAYWVEHRDLDQADVVAAVLREAGLDADALLAAAGSEPIRQALRARTDRAIEQGVFGVPAFPLDDGLLWGQDRLERLERRLGGKPPTPPIGPPRVPVECWFDYSSPYARVGVARARPLLGDALQLRPMLLGALFRAVGTPDVPLLAASAAKADWLRRDLQAQAEEAGVALRWPTRFPLRTVLPLRVTLLAGTPDALVQALFDAFWIEDRDPADPDVVAGVCRAVGLDGDALVEAEPDARVALREATAEAEAQGVFGAPTFVVDGRVFWGNDRLELAAAAAADPEGSPA